MQANGLKTVACLTAHRCVATDDAQSFSFNPTSTASPGAHTIDPGHQISAIACPDALQCTAVDSGGFGVTFGAAGQFAGSPVQLRAGTSLDAIACPLASECVAVGAGGTELRFDPSSPPSTPATIPSG